MKDYTWFIRADLSQYEGEWIAILNKQVLAHNRSGKELMGELKARHAGKKPLIAKVLGPTPICY